MATRTGKIRQNKQMGFVDAALADWGGRRSAVPLARSDAATLWETIAAPIRTLPEYCNRGAGYPSWCPALMLKCLMLQTWFNLSDPGLEEALRDRIDLGDGEPMLRGDLGGVVLPLITPSTTAELWPAVQRWISS
jgi:hypothetical protein